MLLARYVYGDDLLSEERSGNVAYYHPDGLGSTRVLTDSIASVVATYTYDAFGQILEATGSVPTPYLFAGEQYAAVAQAYYSRKIR